MTTSARLGVLAVLSAAPFAHGAEAERPPFEDEAWAWFAEQLGTVDDRSALQAHLPDVRALDIAWTRSLMAYDRAYLAFPGTTAGSLLAPLDSQLARKAWAEAGVTTLRLLLRPENAVESREEAADLDRALWAHLHRTGTMEALGLRADRLREMGVAPAMLAWVQHAARLDTEAMALFHVSAHDLVHMADYQLIRKVRTDAYVAALASRIRCPGPGAGDDRADRNGARPALRQRPTDADAARCDAADAFCRLSPFTGRPCTAAAPRCHDQNAIRGRCLDASGDARRHGPGPRSGDPDDVRGMQPFGAIPSLGAETATAGRPRRVDATRHAAPTACGAPARAGRDRHGDSREHTPPRQRLEPWPDALAEPAVLLGIAAAGAFGVLPALAVGIALLAARGLHAPGRNGPRRALPGPSRRASGRPGAGTSRGRGRTRHHTAPD